MINTEIKESEIELSIIMPCLNEAETIGTCIKKALEYIKTSGISAEIVIGDNGSTDGSQEISKNLGARVVDIPVKGYGAALLGAINASKGKYIIMGDSDDSYDFLTLQPFVDKLREGNDLVMGNRFKGGIQKGAMPFLHRYLGNPVLSFIGRLFFNIAAKDFHCGLRGFNKQSILSLNLITTGMEFASEMVVKSALFKLKIVEVPTTLAPDGRSRPPHLRTWRDGWRHLRFLLLYSPKWLFLIPGVLFFLFSVVFFIITSFTAISLAGIKFDIHTLTYLGSMIIISYQLILFYMFSKTYCINQGLLPASFSSRILNLFSLEASIIVGLILFLGGLSLGVYLFSFWAGKNFGSIVDLRATFRILIPSIVLLITGIQTIFSGFMLSTLGIITNNRRS